MKTLVRFLPIIALSIFISSCKKEMDIKEPVVDVKSKLIGFYNVKYLEQETYSGNTLTNKFVFIPKTSSFEYKTDMTYVSIYESQTPETGTWELVSDSYLRLDKGKANDRYYHIISLDNKNLVYRGPFDANGNVKFGYLSTVYNFK